MDMKRHVPIFMLLPFSKCNDWQNNLDIFLFVDTYVTDSAVTDIKHTEGDFTSSHYFAMY